MGEKLPTELAWVYDAALAASEQIDGVDRTDIRRQNARADQDEDE